MVKEEDSLTPVESLDSFEIKYDSLTASAQQRFLEFMGVSESEDLNLDIVPLAVVNKDAD